LPAGVEEITHPASDVEDMSLSPEGPEEPDSVILLSDTSLQLRGADGQAPVVLVEEVIASIELLPFLLIGPWVENTETAAGTAENGPGALSDQQTAV
jgi:hypothetical protein